MRTRIAYPLIAIVLFSVAGVAVFRTWRRQSTQPAGVTEGPPAAGTGPARVVLNEVLLLPIAGEPQWVELLNAGGEPTALDGVVLGNHTGEKFVLPNRLTLAAGGVLLVRFDGGTGADGSTVHAAPTTFLAPAGFVELSGAGQGDRIAWGDGQPRAASLSRGGDQEPLTPGTSLGRVPRLVETDPLQWVPYRPQQATPGQPNPQPAVEILLPMDGAIVTGDAGNLTWYPIAGATRYRVQLAVDPSFRAPLFDRTVDGPPVAAPALAPGSYVWRVQAIGADGTTADFSAPSTLTLRARRAAGRSLLDRVLPPVYAQAPAQPTVDGELPIVLDVPMISQHKDTAMLIIESRRETGGHAWDVDHGDLDTADPADKTNCASRRLPC